VTILAEDQLDLLDKIADEAPSVGTFISLSLGGIFLVIDVFNLGMASFEWLQTAIWPGWAWFSLFDGLSYLNVDTYSIYHPETWIGLAKIVTWILASPLCILIPIIGIWLSFKFRSLIRDT
jgi:hypothetical protein